MPLPDSPSFACEHHEGGLERILGVLIVREDPAADSKHHRPMPAHQPSKGVFIAGAGKPLQQEAIRLVVEAFRAHHLPNVA